MTIPPAEEKKEGGADEHPEVADFLESVGL
jgi:hypothetical protein